MTDKTKTIVIASDHFGRNLKNALRDHLITEGFRIDDMGVNGDDPVDYPDIGTPLAEAVAAGKYDRGILICGTGAGMAIVANKVPNVRAVCVTDPYTAERAMASNDAHIITFGSQVIGVEAAKKLLDIWLESEFQGGRSLPKVNKLKQLDRKYRTSIDEQR